MHIVAVWRTIDIGSEDT
jgi:hypothetical protein